MRNTTGGGSFFQDKKSLKSGDKYRSGSHSSSSGSGDDKPGTAMRKKSRGKGERENRNSLLKNQGLIRDPEVTSHSKKGGPMKIGFNVDHPDGNDSDPIGGGGSTARFDKGFDGKNIIKKSSRQTNRKLNQNRSDAKTQTDPLAYINFACELFLNEVIQAIKDEKDYDKEIKFQELLE